MKPRTQQLLGALARVDWPSTLQRVGVFMRALRGDAPELIDHAHAQTRQRAERLQTTIERAARAAAGCSFQHGCTCPACALQPFARPTAARKNEHPS